jgi:hypothetical protein
MSLSYNPSLDTFNLLVPGDDQRAVAAGLTLSTKATGPRGEKVFYPADYDKKPVFNPYAVLDFYDEADGAARAKLSSYMRDYKSSWAQTYNGDFPHPETSIETGEPLEYMQFQKAGIAFGLEKGNILIGDEPGLGKTVEAIGICNAKSSERNLIICPASIRLQWYKKIREWSSIENVVPYPVMKAASGVNDFAHYVIVSYDLTRHSGIHDALCALKWDNIVIDEAHYLKSTDARRTQAIFGASGPPSPYFIKNLLKRCGNVIALTGTPLPNRPRECLDGSVKVLTNHGWKPIVDVLQTDLLWDGLEWVKHDGLLFQGYAKTVSVAGISATAQHNFLGKSSWVLAEEAYQNTDIIHQLLERGSENLPSPELLEANVKPPQKLKFGVNAVQKSSQPHYSDLEQDDHQNADLAALLRGAIKHSQNISGYVPIITIAVDYLRSLGTSFRDAIIPRINTIGATARGVSASAKNGERIGQLSSNMLSHFLVGTNPIFNWIGRIMKRDINPATFASSPTRRICKTGEQSMKCSNASLLLKPVYDIANAGPRRRFTVLSDFGPIISHNCYTLARAICFESIDYMSFDEFCYRFNPSAREIDGDKVFTMEKKGRLPELQARLRTNFMIRRMKEDVQKELPKKRYELTYVESNGKIKEVLAKERMLHFKIEELKDPFAEIWGMISTIRREMGEAKVPRVIEHVRYLLDLVEIPKICLFAHHRSVMNTLAQELGHYGLVQIRGGVSPLARQSNIDQFRKDEFTRIFLGQMDASGFGVDGLQDVCDWAVFAEPSWTPGINEQVVDRLHRIGQKRNVLAQFLIVEGSLDERILAANFEKVHTIHESLDRRL